MAPMQPKRRATDCGWRSYRDVTRDLVTIIALAFALAGVVRSQQAVTRQDEGRRIGSAVTCAAVSAVIDAGRATIKAGAIVRPREFAEALQELGLPSPDTRRALAAAAAQQYATAISRAVVEQSGVQGLVRDDGTLDCARLRAAAHIDG